MAERVRSVPTPIPVAALVGAWNDRSADDFAGAFALDARLSIPPLHLEFEGRDDIWHAVGRLFGAFGALRYTLRHRYLSPEGVTDEALLEGLQTLEFLGAPPTGKPGAVAARVMVAHDGAKISSLTLWPDVAALRELSDGVARRIDLRTAGPAAPVVAALRATIPAPEGKYSIGQGRQLAAVDEVSTLLPGAPGADPVPTPSHGVGTDDEKARKKGGPKAPLPRKVKRRRAIAAGAAMLTVAGVLVAYVAVGVNRTKVPVAAEPTPRPEPGRDDRERGAGTSPHHAEALADSLGPSDGVLQQVQQHLLAARPAAVRDRPVRPAGGGEARAHSGRERPGDPGAVRKGARLRLHGQHRAP